MLKKMTSVKFEKTQLTKNCFGNTGNDNFFYMRNIYRGRS
jgi:hypothetical protein